LNTLQQFVYSIHHWSIWQLFLDVPKGRKSRGWMLLWGFTCRYQYNFFHINCLCTSSFYMVCHRRVNIRSLPDLMISGIFQELSAYWHVLIQVLSFWTLSIILSIF
jgi:hypothetical protein